jgi:hypothetical protein
MLSGHGMAPSVALVKMIERSFVGRPGKRAFAGSANGFTHPNIISETLKGLLKIVR